MNVLLSYDTVYSYQFFFLAVANENKDKRSLTYKLFNKFLVCSPNHFGPSCARCKEKCQTCDSTTGRCTKCKSTFYGEECQYRCPQYCFNMTCNQTTGTCDSCQDGYKGQRCELEITTVVDTGQNLSLN